MAEGRTHIRVKLSIEGRAILGGIEWAELDLPPGFSTRVSKDVNELSEVNKLLTDGVESFSVPFSTTNDAAFLSFSSPIIADNRDTGIEARVIVDSHELPFDRVWIKQKNDPQKQWEIEVRRSPSHWLELASVKKLCEIDCGQVTLNDASIDYTTANQFYVEGESPERWFPVDYGGWVDLGEPAQFTDPPVKQVWPEDLRPWVSLPYLLKQGFCEIGWTLTGQILDAFWVKALYIYILGREYYNQSKGGDFKLALASPDFALDSWSSLVGSPIVLPNVQYDPGDNAVDVGSGGPVYLAGITNNMGFKARFKFCFSATIENTAGTTESIAFDILEWDLLSSLPSGLVIHDSTAETYRLNAGQTQNVTVCYEVELEPDQTATFYVKGYVGIRINKGYNVNIEPANNSLVRGDVVELNRLFNCDLILLDLFKGFVHLIGGRIETDWANRTVTVHPYRTTNVAGNSVPGFIQDGETPIDINGKIICDSVRMSRVKNGLQRYTQLSFADSTDTYIESMELPQPAFSRKVLNSIELPDQVQELKNPFFEPTMEGRPDALKRRVDSAGITRPMVYLPRLWDNDTGERSFVIGPRILMYYGDVGQLDTEKNDLTYFYFNDTVFTSHFPYAAQIPTLPHHPTFPPTLDGSVIYGTTNEDLYVTFYLGLLQRQKRGVYLDALVLLSSNDYAAWNFRVPFSFVYQGRPIKALAEKISDFAHAIDTPTPMRLLVEPSDTVCCDLPCSCRFIECDYYQDFGQYITQETLDDLSVTSFKVNSVEQLLAPVDFGIINIIEFTGKQFVTNLIDTLNALAIDYFTFRPSTQDYPDKLDARYFKIKRPACWGFEIIISDSGGEVYKYTDFDQAQQWFDATWTGFGYDSDIALPSECVTTVEY